jgi:[acyl-carrier-protein] S-malonyltransferase
MPTSSRAKAESDTLRPMGSLTVCLFPGQGSQRVGMGRDLADAFPIARETFEEASDRLSVALERLCFEGPEEMLRLTAHAQPAILTVSVAAFRVLEQTIGLKPVAAAGHSLGEWSALVAAGALRFGDAIAAVRERGRLMQEAVPEGEGAMAAIMGLDTETVIRLCAEMANGDVLAPANLNGGGQVVVAGHACAVRRLLDALSASRARVKMLPVSAPFHCALMEPAAARLAQHLRGIKFAAPAFPVITSVEARPPHDVPEIPELLVRQLTAPVRWEETVRALTRFGAHVALEVGPGRVLCGLLRRIEPALRAIPVGDADGIRRASEGSLGEQRLDGNRS